MKTRIEAVFAAFLSLGAAMDLRAQGTVVFDTFNSNPAYGLVFQPHSTTPLGPPLGADFVGQIWYGDVNSMDSMSAAGLPVGFSINTPGYIQDGTVSLPAHPAGSTVYLQLRVWNLGAGAAWEVALGSSALLAKGVSAITPCLLGGVDAQGNVFALQQFNSFPSYSTVWGDEPLPEPSSLASFVLGAAALLWRRRKAGGT
jgi:hypothetical protein